MTETTKTVGVQIYRSRKVGSEYVTVRVLMREGDNAYPQNATASIFDASDEPMYDGLTLSGYVSDIDGKFNLFSPSYDDVFTVPLRKAERMVKMLKKIERQMIKDDAREPGDVFASFAKAIGAKWVVTEIGSTYATSYAAAAWRFMPVCEGRNVFRTMVSNAVEGN